MRRDIAQIKIYRMAPHLMKSEYPIGLFNRFINNFCTRSAWGNSLNTDPMRKE